MNRVAAVAHIDLDAFYTQVEAKRDPQIKGKPIVVIQYNPWGSLETLRPSDNRIQPGSNGSIIAVSYEARAFGVKRNMQAQQAKKLCPDLVIVQVPTAHGKADLTIYREAGSQVAKVLSVASVCERASIDEVYLDITSEAMRRMHALESSATPDCPDDIALCHVCGLDSREAVKEWWRRPAHTWSTADLLLACAANIVSELRARVLQELGFTCSAGIAHYKVLAKLASGLHKPKQQTLVRASGVAGLLEHLPVSKLRQLGGKFGEQLQAAFGISTVGELAALEQSQLAAAYGHETGMWLWRLARGIDSEQVKPRLLPKSLSCGKTFRGSSALQDLAAVHSWFLELGAELQERLVEDSQLHGRSARLLTVGISCVPPATKGASPSAGRGRPQQQPQPGDGHSHSSRSCPLRRYAAEAIADDASMLVKKWAADRPGWMITALFLTASNFAAPPAGTGSITRFLRKPAADMSPSSDTAGADQQQQEVASSSCAASPDSRPQRHSITASSPSHDMPRGWAGFQPFAAPRAGDSLQQPCCPAAPAGVNAGAVAGEAAHPSGASCPEPCRGAGHAGQQLGGKEQQHITAAVAAAARSQDQGGGMQASSQAMELSLDWQLQGSQHKPYRLEHVQHQHVGDIGQWVPTAACCLDLAAGPSCSTPNDTGVVGRAAAAGDVDARAVAAATEAADSRAEGSAGCTDGEASKCGGHTDAAPWQPLEWESVDPEVLAELPPQLQQEIRHQLQLQCTVPNKPSSRAGKKRKGLLRSSTPAGAGSGKQAGIKSFFSDCQGLKKQRSTTSP